MFSAIDTTYVVVWCALLLVYAGPALIPCDTFRSAGKVISFTYPEEDFVVQRFSNELGVPITAKIIKSK